MNYESNFEPIKVPHFRESIQSQNNIQRNDDP